jgi:hypothetical protein
MAGPWPRVTGCFRRRTAQNHVANPAWMIMALASEGLMPSAI